MKMLSLWLHIILCLGQYQTGFPSLVNSTSKDHLCHEEEKQALLQLSELVPPQHEFHLNPWCPETTGNSAKPMYWKQRRDCCLWDGVTCDESTGHVIGLDLSCSGLTGNIHSNSTLFRLTHLRNLNLAYNNFSTSKISFKFGQLKSLTHLNLSYSGFSGHIPLEFYHLSNLVSLDITRDIGDPTLYCDHIKTLFGNMTKLRVVLLGGVDISSELPLNMSSFLTRLDLGSTGVHGNLPPTIFEKPNMQILFLSENEGLTGSLPSFNRSSVALIEKLVLRQTSISGKLPHSIGFMKNLNLLDLSRCKLSGPIPDTIGNLTHITEIYLSRNNFSGEVPSTISNLRQLTLLFLAQNNLQGQLPVALSDLQKLSDIDLSHNSIQGMVPSWLLSLPSLSSIDLSSNRLTGEIGKFNSESLTRLDLSNNQLNIELESFSNLSQIRTLSLSHNTVREQGYKFVNFSLPNLNTLELSSCEMKEFPDLLRNLSVLESLDLSNNKIHGPIPSWFNLPLYNLNLSINYLTHVQYLPQSLMCLDLHSNLLQDTIPESFKDLILLRLLDLSHNSFSGSIPPALRCMTKLELLDLSSNQLRGGIPQALTNLTFLAVLNLSHNHLVGPIPKGNQFYTFSKESYVGNSGLCGDPLTTSCGGEPPSAAAFDEDDEEEDGFMKGFTWKTVVIGYACGILFGFILGNVMITAQKPKWLARFVYTEAAIILRRRKNRAARMLVRRG